MMSRDTIAFLAACLIMAVMYCFVTPAFASEPNIDAESYAKLADDYFRNKKYSEAVEYYSKAISLDRRNVELHEKRKKAEEYVKILSDIAKYTEKIKLEPNNVEAYHMRANSYQKLYDARKHDDDYEKGVADITKAIELNHYNVDFYLTRARFYELKNEIEKEFADYNKAIELDPQKLYGRAYRYVYLGEYDKAVEDFTRLIVNNGYSCDGPEFYYLERGRVFDEKGEYDKAISDYNMVVNLQGGLSDGEWIHILRGKAYAKNGEFDMAIADYTFAIDNTRQEPPEGFRVTSFKDEAYYWRGKVYVYNDELGKAVDDFSHVRDLPAGYHGEHSYYFIRAGIRKFLALKNISKESSAKFAEELRREINTNYSGKNANWSSYIARYILKIDNVTEEELLREAKMGTDEADVSGRLCEAYYYIGEERLFAGDKKGATKFFQKSVDTNARAVDEFHEARAKLEKL